MIKGVIADVSGKRAVLLTENGEFITIRNERYAIGQKITYRKPSMNKYTAIAACLALVVILGSVGSKLYYTSSSYIDIDINPSIRLELNSFDKVIKVVPLNDDAEEIIATKKISGDIETCINDVVDISKDKGYINPENTDVEIVVVSNKTEVVNSVNEVMEEVAAADTELSVKVEQADYEELKTAMDLNVSVGRLKVLEEYTNEHGGTLKDNAEELASASNSQIKALKSGNEDNALTLAPTEKPSVEVAATPGPENAEETVKTTSAPKNNSVKPQYTITPEVTKAPVSTPDVVVTKAPTAVPTVKPTEVPTVEPTEIPTVEPTEVPTVDPTEIPTVEPTVTPTVEPTIEPTPEPTATPTPEPTELVTPNPTTTPTVEPDDNDFPFWPPWFDWIFGDIFD